MATFPGLRLRTDINSFPHEKRKVYPGLLHEASFREIENRGYSIESFNHGHMLRIGGCIDVYPKSLKYLMKGDSAKGMAFVDYEHIVEFIITKIRSYKPKKSLQRRNDPYSGPIPKHKSVKRYRKSI